MVGRYRAKVLHHQVVTLDPARAVAGGFNALDWIDPASPLAESHMEAVVGWIAGEVRGRLTSGAEFFRETGKGLVACLLAHLLWDPTRPPEEKTLRELRRLLVTPEDEMRALLADVHAGSHSSMARDFAGTLKGLVVETFSGVYAIADPFRLALRRPAETGWEAAIAIGVLNRMLDFGRPEYVCTARDQGREGRAVSGSRIYATQWFGALSSE